MIKTPPMVIASAAEVAAGLRHGWPPGGRAVAGLLALPLAPRHIPRFSVALSGHRAMRTRR